MIAVGLLVLLIGFAMVVPRGSMPGSASARNVSLGSQRVFVTRGDQGIQSLRYRVIKTLAGLVLVAVGIILIAASG